jgi:glycerol-3-phosphate O-acyltransferase / dihydroxyacetone phosphate acyltransferase
MRRALRAVLRVILRVFFPHIELSGLDRIPENGPVMMIVNHPNGLIDPLFLLCLSPRPVSFLAKAPLFEMPVISWFVKALGSIPVYRRQDAYDPSMNRRTFEQAREVLSGGGIIAIFPEGTSHGDPRLRPLKSGAARIALGATSIGGGLSSMTIVPVGVYYTAKGTFRSDALLYFGPPISISKAVAMEDGEPASADVRALTQRMTQALDEVTLQADEREALALVARAETIFTSADPSTDARLVDHFELRRRFMAGYTTLRAQAPERLASITSRIGRYESELQQSGLDPHTLQANPGAVFRMTESLGSLITLVLVMPLAIIGLVINYPAYRLVGFAATQVSKGEDDVVSTIKVIAGALLFPLTWLIVSTVIELRWGLVAGLVALVIAPVAAYAALYFFERLDRFVASARALLFFHFRRWGFLQLVDERRAIREEIERLTAELDASTVPV